MSEAAPATAQSTTEAVANATTVTASETAAAKTVETTETKTAAVAEGTKTVATEVKPETKEIVEPKSVVPEKYDLKMPDGSPLTKAYSEKIASYAKEQGLSNEAAQKVLERDHSVVTDFVEAQRAALKERSEAWVTELEGDKEFGGDHFNKNVELVHRVVDQFAPEDLKQTLRETGYGNHPGLVRFLHRICQAAGASEDSFFVPKSQSATAKDMAEQFYGGSKT